MNPAAHPPWVIRPLLASEGELYRPLRLAALRQHPAAFSSDYAEEAQMSAANFAARMPPPPGALFGGFVRGANGAPALVGIVGLMVQARAKLHHKGMLFGMYVDPAFRRTGLGAALVESVIARARDAGLRVVHLTVTSTNHAARLLYARAGFRCCGTEPRALCIDGVLYDDELMALMLD